MQNFCVIRKNAENAEPDPAIWSALRLSVWRMEGLGLLPGFGRHRLHAYGDWTHRANGRFRRICRGAQFFERCAMKYIVRYIIDIIYEKRKLSMDRRYAEQNEKPHGEAFLRAAFS